MRKTELLNTSIGWLRTKCEEAKRREEERARIKGTVWELVKFVPLLIGALFFGMLGMLGSMLTLTPAAMDAPFPLWVPWFMAILCLGGGAIQANKFFKAWPRARRERMGKGWK